ncbi:MAPEG family protein [Pseudochrobactrum sp. AO18b]|uniref:MAPEG family protein n=1 Tax=Pseudochrobactrum sp. AO18b TaxID=1201036 RepID=UPI00039E6A3B|nr:MAPEG family protein [Pseudochrobactrum sp. AO18b]
MSTELNLAVVMLIVAIIQVLLPAFFRNGETGLDYNAGPRDEAGPPVGIITARLQRAQRNLYETLPLFLAAVLIAHIAGRESGFTTAGAWIYVIGRIFYIPAYAFGIPYVRSLIWVVSLAGLGMIILALTGLFV